MEQTQWNYCTVWAESTLKISHRIMYKNSKHFMFVHMFVHMLSLELIMLVSHILQSGVVQKNKLSYQSIISDISDWACDPSLSAKLVGLKMHSADNCIPLLSQEITVMRLFQGFHTMLVGDMPEMSWFPIDCSIRLICIFILILLETVQCFWKTYYAFFFFFAIRYANWHFESPTIIYTCCIYSDRCVHFWHFCDYVWNLCEL